MHDVERDYMNFINKQMYKIQRKIDSARMKFISDRITDREYASIAIVLEEQLNDLNVKKKVFKCVNKKDKYNLH